MLNVLAIVGFLLIVAVILWHDRPLCPTTDWLVDANTHQGDPMSVETYKVLGREMFFLRVDNCGFDMPKNRLYPRWFVVDFSDTKEDVVILTHPRMGALFGWDLALERLGGIDILDKALKELWDVTYTGNSVVFSNQAFSVFMTKKDSL